MDFISLEFVPIDSFMRSEFFIRDSRFVLERDELFKRELRLSLERDASSFREPTMDLISSEFLSRVSFMHEIFFCIGKLSTQILKR